MIRTGCLACRARGQPCGNDALCTQHASTDWLCNRSTSAHSPISSSILSVDYSWEATHRERHSLHFFSIITATTLSGYLDASFWQESLLQASQDEAAIKHAVAAIGASHEYLLRSQASRFNSETDGLRPFALRQCNKAIRILIKPSSATMTVKDILRCLTISVLFICFETLNGNPDAATQHVLSGKRLLRQHQRATIDTPYYASDFPVAVESLKPLIAHHDVQMEDSEVETTQITFNPSSAVCIESMADVRISLEQAISAQGIQLTKMTDLDHPVDFAMAAQEKLSFVPWFHRWDEALSQYLSTLTVLDAGTLRVSRLLKAHQIAALLLATVSIHDPRTAWHGIEEDGKAIVDLLSEVLAQLPKHSTFVQATKRISFTQTMGMMEPLYLVATRCRDVVVAERARVLLNNLPSSENAQTTWRIDEVERILHAAVAEPYHGSSRGSFG